MYLTVFEYRQHNQTEKEMKIVILLQATKEMKSILEVHIILILFLHVIFHNIIIDYSIMFLSFTDMKGKIDLEFY